MVDWFHDTVVRPGRLPLFCFFVGMIVSFAVIRFSVRMIRAQVRWWPGNVTPGGMHIHHVVFGVVFMLLGGVIGLAIPAGATGWRAAAAAVFGAGSALVLDEFALILHLRDVYWSKQGRTSIDAVFVAVAVTGLLVLGVRPIGLDDLLEANSVGGAAAWTAGGIVTLLSLSITAITLLKGKIWTGLLGIFLPILLIVGSIRLARPHSPWARWRYRSGRRGPAKMARATRREERVRRPLSGLKVRLQDLIAGRPNQ